MGRRILGFLGLLVCALGLLWIGQGLGYIKWPEQSFMISQTPWVIYGGIVSLIGLFLMGIAWKR